MSFLSPDSLLSALRARYATKQFDPEKEVPEELWDALEQSLILTASSFGLQPWKFLILKNREIREKLVPHTWGQRQVADCSHLIVMLSHRSPDDELVRALLGRTAELRGDDIGSLDGYGAVMRGFLAKMSPERRADWARHQVYIALGNILTCAAVLGLDACPMEGFSAEAYDRELGLEGTEWTSVVLCPVGFRAESDTYASLAKVRFDRETLIEMR